MMRQGARSYRPVWDGCAVDRSGSGPSGAAVIDLEMHYVVHGDHAVRLHLTATSPLEADFLAAHYSWLQLRDKLARFANIS
jgi:hypothetical protein